MQLTQEKKGQYYLNFHSNYKSYSNWNITLCFECKMDLKKIGILRFYKMLWKYFNVD